MNKGGHVTAGFEVNEPKSNEPVWQLWTDCPEKLSAVFIPLDGPRPTVGEWVEWSTHHVLWRNLKVRKIGLSFDPDAPLR